MTHVPVLLKEVITLLNPKDGDWIIDATAGSGGHAKEILEKIGKKGKLILVDWDLENIHKLKKIFIHQSNVMYLNINYADLSAVMKKTKIPLVNGLLIDLGFSSEQLEESGRGFSFLKEEPLLMTYNQASEPLSNFLQRTTVKELGEIIKKFGEERYAELIAKSIIKNRSWIKTSRQLGEVIKEAVPVFYERGRIHPATRTFQALRIYLNRELDNLKKILQSLREIVKPGGRVAIISFHSLEDRIVKTQFKEFTQKGRLQIITKKPIVASYQEILRNRRAKSAKLRATIIQ